MLLLGLARLMVAAMPFGWWRHLLGSRAPDPVPASPAAARCLASHIERAALRLPFATKCLPRAMALSWMLRRRHIGHTVVLAVRPPEHRAAGDSLHAWVELGGKIVLGELAGPWMRVLALGGCPAGDAAS